MICLVLHLLLAPAPTGAPPEAAPPPAGEPAPGQPTPQGPSPAMGGRDMTPLPPPPANEPIKSLARGPWRGVGWVAGRVELVVPIAGKRPARGEVVSGAGAIELGWRIKNYLALRTGLSLAIQDAEVSRLEDVYGNRYTAVDYGELLGFELVGIRGYLPVSSRFQPYLDASGGLGLWFPAVEGNTEVGGLARFALGFDGWVSPNFTLGLDTAYRLFALEDSTGHFLTLGGHLAIHW